MPSFRYRALGPDGRPETGQLEAPDRPAAVRRLASDGLTPTRITEAAANPVLDLLNVELTPKAGLKPAARAGLTRDLAGLAAASVPLDDALDLLGGGGGPIGEVARDLAQRLRGGASLSQAMAERADAFPRASVNLVRAGEESGDLAGALDRLAEMEEASEALKQKLISASIYPAFLILTAIGVIGVLIRIVVPQFAPIFDAAGRDLPGPTRLLLAISNAAADYGGFALVGLGLGLLGLLAVRATPKGRAALDRFALRVPGLGGLLRDLAVARLTRTLNGLLGGGLALDRALPITADVMTNTAFANLVRASERVVRAGEPFWRSLRGSGLMRPRDVELIRLGEENGALEPMTARLASMAERDAQRRIDRGLSLLTPVLTLVMGLIAGFIIVSLLSAILGLNDLV